MWLNITCILLRFLWVIWWWWLSRAQRSFGGGWSDWPASFTVQSIQERFVTTHFSIVLTVFSVREHVRRDIYWSFASARPHCRIPSLHCRYRELLFYLQSIVSRISPSSYYRAYHHQWHQWGQGNRKNKHHCFNAQRYAYCRIVVASLLLFSHSSIPILFLLLRWWITF